MATAAPAAPSPSAPASAQPAPGAGNDAAPAPDSVGVPAPPDSAPRLVKPIRPIPSLPGVFPDDDPFPVGASRPDAAADSASRPSAKTPARGPDGQFVAASSTATPDGGEPALEAATPPPTPTTKFKFGGEEFDSQEAAEQNFRSLRGQYRPLQSLARSLGGIDKIQPTFVQAAESARGWKAEAERLTAELQTLRSGRQPAPSPSSTPNPAAPDADAADTSADVDWELYAEIKKLANDSGEPWKAEQWLIEQVRKADRAHYESMLDERFAPIADAEQRAEVVHQTETLFSSLAEYVNADGSVAYPELHDEAASYQIGRMWASLGLPPEAALTPQGAIAAIAIYRMAKGGSQAGSVAPALAAARPAAPTSPPLPTDAHAAASLGDGRVPGLSIPDGAPGSVSAEAQRVLQGLRQANRGNRAVLGFDA